MKKFYFEIPTIKRKIDALEFVQEFYKYGVDLDGTGGLIKHFPHDYEGWLEQLEKNYNQIPSEDRMPSNTYFLIRENDNKIIGLIYIRLTLNEKLKHYGGNIGYCVRPLERNKGYNKINLYLALKICDSNNLKEVMLDANIDNIASWKTMEALGGRRFKEYYNQEVQHVIVDYMIDVKSGLEIGKKYEPNISYPITR